MQKITLNSILKNRKKESTFSTVAHSIANHFSNSLARMDLLSDLADELPV
jgi:hypothetical protein